MKMKIKKGGFIENAIKNNQQHLQPIYDTSASIGIAYSLFTTIIGTIICVLLIIIGVWVKNLNKDKTAYTTGIVKDVSDCNYKAKSCISTIEFKVNDKDYSVKSATGIGNKGQYISIYYNPENPNNFTINNYSNYIGLIMIIISSVIILALWLWFILTLIFKPVAAASGVGAVTNAIIPDY